MHVFENYTRMRVNFITFFRYCRKSGRNDRCPRIYLTAQYLDFSKTERDIFSISNVLFVPTYSFIIFVKK